LSARGGSTWLCLAAVATLGAAPAFADEAEKLGTAQIATVVLAANQVAIDRGNLVAKRSKHTEVRQLAEQMAIDHTNARQDVVALVTKLRVQQETSELTRTLKESAAQTLGKLKKLRGTELDNAYVDAEVSAHESFIDKINGVLLPGASQADLRKLLDDTLTAQRKHLGHAQQVQKLLRSTTAASK
jgi:putative membrane protein